MTPATGVAARSRELLVFVLGKEEYGVDILKVQEIRGYDRPTPIPGAPDFLRGVVNLRGTIVPVIDLRLKFGIPEPAYDAFTVVVILRIGSRVVGAVVDGVSDVIELAAEEMKPTPRLGAVVDGSFLAGVVARKERIVLVLDIEKLLSSAELGLIDQAADASAPGSA